MIASDKPRVLMDVVSKVLDAGATAFEVEYKDGLERVFACNGPIGVGVAAYRSDGREAQELRSQLYAMGRGRKKIKVSGVEYVLKVEIFDFIWRGWVSSYSRSRGANE